MGNEAGAGSKGLGLFVTSDGSLADADRITESSSMTQLKRLEVAGPQDVVSVFLSFPPSLSSSFLRADLFHGDLSGGQCHVLYCFGSARVFSMALVSLPVNVQSCAPVLLKV